MLAKQAIHGVQRSTLPLRPSEARRVQCTGQELGDDGHTLPPHAPPPPHLQAPPNLHFFHRHRLAAELGPHHTATASSWRGREGKYKTKRWGREHATEELHTSRLPKANQVALGKLVTRRSMQCTWYIPAQGGSSCCATPHLAPSPRTASSPVVPWSNCMASAGMSQSCRLSGSVSRPRCPEGSEPLPLLRAVPAVLGPPLDSWPPLDGPPPDPELLPRAGTAGPRLLGEDMPVAASSRARNCISSLIMWCSSGCDTPVAGAATERGVNAEPAEPAVPVEPVMRIWRMEAKGLAAATGRSLM